MGKRGPKKTPTAILRARGSWLAMTRPNEPQALGLPTCPKELTEAEKKIWHWVVPKLVAQGTASEIDQPMIAAYCRYEAAVRECADLLTVAEAGTIERARIVNEMNQAMNHVEKLSARFGLTPADRAGLKVEDAAPEKSDAARFFEEAN